MEEDTVSANKLLLWMSARGQGSWQQFRAAVEELHLVGGQPEAETENEDVVPFRETFSAYQSLRLNLQRLGHAEFFAGAGESEWRVAPPTLAVTQSDGAWIGILAGARSLELLERLREAAASSVLETISFAHSPDQILIKASEEMTLKMVAMQSSVFFQQNAPIAILGCLPTVDDPVLRRPRELPFGSDWKVERFSATRLAWVPATREQALGAIFGLFRFSFRHQRDTFLCSNHSFFHVPGQVGKFLLLKRRRSQVFRYDPATGNLTVPTICRPPFLIERALILCSGKIPAGETRPGAKTLLHYYQVPKITADYACGLLRQELR